MYVLSIVAQFVCLPSPPPNKVNVEFCRRVLSDVKTKGFYQNDKKSINCFHKKEECLKTALVNVFEIQLEIPICTYLVL